MLALNLHNSSSVPAWKTYAAATFRRTSEISVDTLMNTVLRRVGIMVLP